MKPSIFHSQSASAAEAKRPGRTPHSRSGVALVVTLIMLSVITFMAITFLVLSRSEHGAVAVETDQTQARLAAETAMQRAIAQALAPMMAQTNELSYGLMVSTNYISPFGFVSGNTSPTNVNYDYRSDHLAFSAADWAQNISNLWFDPRPPVFITNRFSAAGGYEFRFFHNLNRNTNLLGAVFDPTGWLAVTNQGVKVGTISNWFLGDPQWIGILNFPDRPHAADNRFLSRFAYLVIPAGSALDMNYIHNQANRPNKTTLDQYGVDFLRNQGVGPWEENLASFLCDLNTNVWGRNGDYLYDPVANQFPTPTTTSFIDAFSLIRYRYGCTPTDLALNTTRLASFYNIFPNGQTPLNGDGNDDYSAGPLMGVTWPPVVGTTPQPDPDLAPAPAPRGNYPWPGGYNINHFLTPQELFDTAKTSPGFVSRLMAAGNDTTSSYNEYTFYRMLAQLGSDSAGDGGRINLNYRNIDDYGHVVPNMETNFIGWLPDQFFTNTANALLRTYGYNFTITNIQIYPTNFYTPSVHRLLQMAANIYDSSTNRYNGYPTVFRPYFRQVASTRSPTGRIVYIAGYHEITNDASAFGFGPADTRPVVLGVNDNLLPIYGAQDGPAASEMQVLGIPLIIGAKKGFPNFNEFGMQTQVSVTRKLQFRRPPGSNTGPIVETNQMYLVTITNTFGLEAWNSYMSTYPGRLEVRMDAVLLATITNELGTLLLSNAVTYQPTAPAVIAQNTWRGFAYPQLDTTPNSFRAVIKSGLFLTNSAYADGLHRFVVPGDFEEGRGFPTPHWYMSLRPMVRFALVDTTVVPNRIIDYVSFDSRQLPADLTPLLTGNTQCGNYYTPSADAGAMWCTNRDNPNFNTPTYGILNQINMALGNQQGGIASGNIQWSPSGHLTEVDFFRSQFPGLSPLHYPNGTFSTTNTFQAPYSPQRIISFYTSWQANDPLVHYTIPDLLDALSRKPAYELDTTGYSSLTELGGLDMYTSQRVGSTTPLNSHYRPWGGNPKNTADTTPLTNWKLEVKDPLMTRSDAWNFPTNKYPNVGWLGRVHRGTPWQTIYLKSSTNDWATWTQWSGDTVLLTNNDYNNTKVVGALFTLPENDRPLLDLFSAAFNDAAARGRMGINQDGLAAWSAILSGVVVLTNQTSETLLQTSAKNPQTAPQLLDLQPLIVQPAGPFDPFNTSTNFWPAVAKIVNGINSTRATRFANHTFTHLGDLLATPELTVNSPFLNQGGTRNPFITGTNRMTYQASVGLNDAAYERIPQQILGLLQCDHTPRFVIYAYGQALKPADRSVINSGPFFQLCTNYQITAEVATRAVVRIDGAPTHPHAVIETFNVLPPE